MGKVFKTFGLVMIFAGFFSWRLAAERSSNFCLYIYCSEWAGVIVPGFGNINR